MAETSPPARGMTASLIAPLPSPPIEDVLTPDQWTTLLSILDTFIPSMTSWGHEDLDKSKRALPDSDYASATSAIAALLTTTAGGQSQTDLIQTYLSETASSVPGFKAQIHRTLGHYTPPDPLASLGKILSFLGTRPGSLLLTGSITPFHLQSPGARYATVLGWSKSYLSPIRQLYRSLNGLSRQTWLALTPTLPKVVGFPAVPTHGTRGKSFDFNFIQLPSAADADVATLETDIVIVGSGCGAGVCAYNLASSGHRVLVLEKGYHFPSSHFPMAAGDAGTQLFENGGIILSDDGSTAVLAGSTFGGGGTVNWSASLQPQHFVRKEWADPSSPHGGVSFFTSAAFQESLDRICAHMGVSAEHIEHNFANAALLEGARRLGYSSHDVPQNTGGRAHPCGYCGAGCAAVTKQGPANRWLPDAADRGAEFMEGCEIKEVEFETSANGKRRAVGVKGIWTSKDRTVRRSVRVKAKRVVVGCGSLQSPLLLIRSGIKNPHLGRNLHLHPTSFIGAVFDEATRPWEGAILTAAVTSLEDLDGKGHGPKIEVMNATPSSFLSFTPWKGALDWKVQCAKFHHMIGLIIIQRDKVPGRVYPDPGDGRCRIEYTTSSDDLGNNLEGMLAAAKIAKVMGAKEIFSCHPDARRYERPESESREGLMEEGVNEAAFQTWLDEIKRLGLKSPDPCILGSAHQMGTCRMSSDARRGVVDSKGLVFGTERLYVADASVFPSASGVNPMVTNMGIADSISRGIAEELKQENGHNGSAGLSAKL
jgi:choline dehydrogenase-like flavoprotein